MAEFLQHDGKQTKNEYKSYSRCQSLSDAVEGCFFYREQRDGRLLIHDHQRRVGRVVLNKAIDKLKNDQLPNCQDFQELEESVKARIANIRGVGPLTVYDAALRIGAYLGIKPRHVYLQTGARDGARALGLDHRKRFLSPSELPPALRDMEPYLVEAFLCIYKDRLRGVAV